MIHNKFLGESQHFILATVVVTALLSVSPVNAGTRQLDLDDRSWEEKQLGAIQSELNLLKTKIALEDSEVQQLLNAVSDEIPELKPTTTDWTAACIEYPERLDHRLRAKLLAQTLLQLPSDQHESVQQVFGNARILEEISDRNSITGTLIFLDNHLCLSIEQLEQLRQLYSERWTAQLSAQSIAMVIYGMASRNVIDCIEEEDFRRVLSKHQFEVYLKVEKNLSVLDQLQIAIDAKADSWDQESFKQSCKQALETKIDELTRVASLEETQLKKLSIARKGAVTQVMNHWSNLVTELSETPTMNFELRASIVEPISSQVTRPAPWQQSLAKILTKEQLEKIAERDAIRETMAKNQSINFYVSTMLRDWPEDFDIDQYVSLVSMLSDNVHVVYGRDYLSISQQIADIEDEKYAELMSDKQWKQFRAGLDLHREKIRAFAEKMKQFGNE